MAPSPVCWRDLLALTALLLSLCQHGSLMTYSENDAVCPTVKAIRHLHLHDMLGHWYVVQYYASSEELPEYRCMRADLILHPPPPDSPLAGPRISMNFTYAFIEDPTAERLQGNITWLLPDLGRPAHWRHEEESYQGVYNTYILDSDYSSWALLLHCAEQAGSPRFLSSFILSRRPELPVNVQAYLRDKLTRYDIHLEYMFPMSQEGCDKLTDLSLPPGPPPRDRDRDRQRPPRRHPLHSRKKHSSV